MRKLLVIALGVVFASLLAPLRSTADDIHGTTGDGFQTWTSADLNINGTPYWDHKSWDGPNLNIGYCLTTTNCGVTSPPGALPFWGESYNSSSDTGGAADPNVFFGSTGKISSEVEVTLAGNKGINEFGWVATNSAGAITGSLNVLFDGANPGATATFTPTSYYAYFLIGASGTWYSVSGQNQNADVNDQHFGFFQNAGGPLWIGAEDLPLANSDLDYNDIVVEVSPVVPEPGTLALMGTFLIAACWTLRRAVTA